MKLSTRDAPAYFRKPDAARTGLRPEIHGRFSTLPEPLLPRLGPVARARIVATVLAVLNLLLTIGMATRGTLAGTIAEAPTVLVGAAKGAATTAKRQATQATESVTGSARPRRGE